MSGLHCQIRRSALCVKYIVPETLRDAQVIPYRDENPTLRTPVVTLVLIGVTSAVWLFVQGAGSQPALARSICELGLIPGELLGRVAHGTLVPVGEGIACRLGVGQTWFTPLTSMFMHGGWFHLIGNMWFFWVFGNNVEDAMGRGRFLGFYLLCGLIAAAAQVAMQPGSPVPMVGASGAISGVMGAYLVLYPRVRVHLLIFLGFFITTIAVPAYFMLLYWVVLQFLGSVPMLGGGGAGGGVAFFAHLGGFAAGAALIKPFARPELIAAHRTLARRPQPMFRNFGGDRWM
jgi:membrane associated rhomboid family serine protease